MRHKRETIASVIGSPPSSPLYLAFGWLIEFALDSPLEGDGFEPSVAHKKQPFLATPVRSPQFAFHNKNRLFRARNRWFEIRWRGTESSNPSPSSRESGELSHRRLDAVFLGGHPAGCQGTVRFL